MTMTTSTLSNNCLGGQLRELFSSSDGLGVIGTLLALCSTMLALGVSGRRLIARHNRRTYTAERTESLDRTADWLSYISLAAGVAAIIVFAAPHGLTAVWAAIGASVALALIVLLFLVIYR